MSTKKVIEAKGWRNAVDEIKRLGLPCDRILAHRILVHRENGTGVAPMPIIMYFMDGNSDVAYYIYGLEVIYILDSPRPWHKELLDTMGISNVENSYLRDLTV